jgi:hypothetical protein
VPPELLEKLSRGFALRLIPGDLAETALAIDCIEHIFCGASIGKNISV